MALHGAGVCTFYVIVRVASLLSETRQCLFWVYLASNCRMISETRTVGDVDENGMA
jgi:hypothetical protein